ncbi:hypothetical protein DXH95_15635 [Sphingorhabdus pulchriflava]|uniref:Peptidase M56 domain-containing protein n=1 Tax=Sphingorhabdus pulchriflava TaxID=2292257 RepID=A0A371B292_9SPHN|nr:M56 family metallopeptidase [Sphingorhabdus pulchriflava]RDV01709.1 hypothetical protein DXH95_15635 [Sphingorhabdus pulchriflava]
MTEWLSDTLLATSALLLLVLLIRGPVARHFGAATAYFLWALPAARLFMPTLTKEVASPTLPFELTAADGARDVALAAVPNGGQAAASVATSAIDWTVIGLTLWLGGAALLFIVQMYRYAALREELLSDAVDIDRIDGIRIIQTDRIDGPLAFGLLRRFIAVPRDFTHTFSPRERDLALEHELAHHRGGDLFANLAAFIVLCLMWFNPLAWMAWSAFRFDQEAACDARVIAGADATTRQTYGRALARTATEGLPAFAMALNSPRTLIQRLRRLTMNETSKVRRLTGKMAILAAAAVALPLTATVVPVFAQSEPAPAGVDAEKKLEVKKHKVVIVKSEDGKPVVIDTRGDAETPFVKTVEKDGKTIVLRSNKEITDSEMANMVAAAIASSQQSEADAGGSEKRTMVMRLKKDGKLMDGAGADHYQFAFDEIEIAKMIPDIEFKEIRGKCNEGEPVTTNIDGFDGQNKSRIRIVMCGKVQANVARKHAIQGLKEARDEIQADGEMPDSIRKDVVKKLEEKIEKMEQQSKDDAETSEDV